jgi:hypothetical protein
MDLARSQRQSEQASDNVGLLAGGGSDRASEVAGRVVYGTGWIQLGDTSPDYLAAVVLVVAERGSVGREGLIGKGATLSAAFGEELG